MKKETKKKVFNFVLVGTIVTSVATLLAVVLGKEANFFAVKEILKVGVKLNVWNWDDNQLKHTIKIGSETPNPELSMPQVLLDIFQDLDMIMLKLNLIVKNLRFIRNW